MYNIHTYIHTQKMLFLIEAPLRSQLPPKARLIHSFMSMYTSTCVDVQHNIHISVSKKHFFQSQCRPPLCTYNTICTCTSLQHIHTFVSKKHFFQSQCRPLVCTYNTICTHTSPRKHFSQCSFLALVRVPYKIGTYPSWETLCLCPFAHFLLEVCRRLPIDATCPPLASPFHNSRVVWGRICARIQWRGSAKKILVDEWLSVLCVCVEKVNLWQKEHVYHGMYIYIYICIYICNIYMNIYI